MTSLKKNDNGKPRTDLLPPNTLLEIAKVFGHGAQKYSDNNWMQGTSWSRYYGAALRHILAWWSGENRDTESGESHLAHAVCCLMILMEYQRKDIGNDDRETTEEAWTA